MPVTWSAGFIPREDGWEPDAAGFPGAWGTDRGLVERFRAPLASGRALAGRLLLLNRIQGAPSAITFLNPPSQLTSDGGCAMQGTDTRKFVSLAGSCRRQILAFSFFSIHRTMARTWQNRIEWTSLARLAGYSCATMADLLGISLRQVQRHFRVTCRQTTHSWLYELRMRDAAQLMGSSLRIYEVAGLLGYKTSSHFHRDFKRYYGVIPSRYRSPGQDLLVGDGFLAQYTELLETAPVRPAKEANCAGRLPVSPVARVRVTERRVTSRIGNLSSL